MNLNLLKGKRHVVCPPMKHNWSLLGSNEDMKSSHDFQHDLLQNFSINMFCKVRIGPIVLFGLFVCHLAFFTASIATCLVLLHF